MKGYNCKIVSWSITFLIKVHLALVSSTKVFVANPRLADLRKMYIKGPKKEKGFNLQSSTVFSCEKAALEVLYVCHRTSWNLGFWRFLKPPKVQGTFRNLLNLSSEQLIMVHDAVFYTAASRPGGAVTSLGSPNPRRRSRSRSSPSMILTSLWCQTKARVMSCREQRVHLSEMGKNWWRRMRKRTAILSCSCPSCQRPGPRLSQCQPRVKKERRRWRWKGMGMSPSKSLTTARRKMRSIPPMAHGQWGNRRTDILYTGCGKERDFQPQGRLHSVQICQYYINNVF